MTSLGSVLVTRLSEVLGTREPWMCRAAPPAPHRLQADQPRLLARGEAHGRDLSLLPGGPALARYECAVMPPPRWATGGHLEELEPGRKIRGLREQCYSGEGPYPGPEAQGSVLTPAPIRHQSIRDEL